MIHLENRATEILAANQQRIFKFCVSFLSSEIVELVELVASN